MSGDRTTALDVSPVNRGGNSLFTTFAMANWTGIADENGDFLKYPEPEDTWATESLYIPSELAYKDILHLENAYWINIDDDDSVKGAVMEYGAVGVSYYYDWFYDSDSYKEGINPSYEGSAVYYNPDVKRMNHVVAVVGWDDTFSRNNFRYTYGNGLVEEYGYGEVKLPTQDGAWLIRNSWGEGIGDNGYFWISYEDVSLFSEGNVFAFDFGLGDNYDHIYQYDGSNGTKSHSTSQQVTAAAVYTANGEQDTFQEIAAVGVGFASASLDYTVKVYIDLADENDPESGVLAAAASGKTSFQGFYTIELDDPVVMEAGDTFGIVVTARKKGQAALFVDASYTNGAWVRFDASTVNDRTFYKSGNTWYDAGKKKNYTFRIKAYTKDIATPVIGSEDRIISAAMLEEIAPQEYTGEPVEPEPVLVFSGERLTRGVDYVVTYSNNIEVSAEERKASMLLTGLGEYAGSELTAEFTIEPKTISAEMITVNACSYDGSIHDDIVTVSHNGKSVQKDRDYTVQYSKTPQNAGSYNVTVNGTGNYSGSVKQNFTIEKLNLEDSDAVSVLLNEEEEYSGKAIKPEVQVSCNGNIIPSSNYNVVYKDNKNAGTAKVTITGKINCMKSVVKEFTILPKSVTTGNMVVSVKEGTYTGEAVIPAVTIKDGKTILKQNRDYVITCEDNILASTAAKVTARGMGNYTGEYLQTFTVKPKAIASKKIAVALCAPCEDGSLGCTVSADGKIIDADQYDLTIKRAADLEEEVDESSLILGEKYNVTVVLKNNYSGNATIRNLVCTKSMNALQISLGVDEGSRYVYTGKALKPAVKVEDEAQILKQGTDYSVSYVDNTNVGEASVTITGKGKYGGAVRIPFVITPKEVTQEELKVSIPAQNYTGKELNPAVTVKYGKKKLKAGTDYVLENYSNNLDVSYNEQQEPVAGAEVEIRLLNYTIWQNGAASDVVTEHFMVKPARITSVTVESCYYSGTKMEPAVTVKAGKLELTPDCYEVNFSDNEKVGGKAKATVSAAINSNYTGSKTVTFKIVKEPFSKVVVEGITDQTYTGREIWIPESAIIVKSSSGAVIDPESYTIQYKNNRKVGTAKMIISAKSESIYSGSQTIKFRINRADLKDVIGDVWLESQSYTGDKLTYTADEIKGAVAMATGIAPTYKISYQDNVDAGTAKVILTGTGSYTGTKEIDFTILPCSMKKAAVRLKSGKLLYDNGNPVYAEIDRIVFGRLTLRQGRDYTVSYVNSKGLGAAYVRITGRGNFSGMKSVYYSIREE